MSYYDNEEAYKQRGIDYDLCACLEHNRPGVSIAEIDKVLAVVEGENDGPDWFWVLALTGARFALLTGGCDYTGWDCQSGATAQVFDSRESLAAALEGFVEEHEYREERRPVVTQSLQTQLASAPAPVWTTISRMAHFPTLSGASDEDRERARLFAEHILESLKNGEALDNGQTNT